MYNKIFLSTQYLSQIGQFPPKESIFYSPDGGWKDETYYHILLSMAPSNPIFEAIFFTTLDSRNLPNINTENIFWRGDCHSNSGNIYYLCPVKLLFESIDFDPINPRRVIWPILAT